MALRNGLKAELSCALGRSASLDPINRALSRIGRVRPMDPGKLPNRSRRMAHRRSGYVVAGEDDSIGRECPGDEVEILDHSRMFTLVHEQPGDARFQIRAEITGDVVQSPSALHCGSPALRKSGAVFSPLARTRFRHDDAMRRMENRLEQFAAALCRFDIRLRSRRCDVRIDHQPLAARRHYPVFRRNCSAASR